jgi:hypothetical protein
MTDLIIKSSTNIIRMVTSRKRWAGRVVRVGEMRNVCIILVGKCEGKRELGRLRCRWKDTVKVDRVWIVFVWLTIRGQG